MSFFRFEKYKDDCHLSAKTLPKDMHSVKGVGKTQPDSNGTVTLSDGVVVPIGKPVINLDVKSPLQYNEYPFISLILISVLDCKRAVALDAVMAQLRCCIQCMLLSLFNVLESVPAWLSAQLFHCFWWRDNLIFL